MTNKILTELQKKVLDKFFELDISKQFFLTGGTALSGYYFQHRESDDLDFFTYQYFDVLTLRKILSNIAESLNGSLEHRVNADMYHAFYIHQGEQYLKLDFVKDVGKYFGKVQMFNKIKVDNIENIGSNKITAVYGRIDIKDFIDLYFILHNSDFSFEHLLANAKQKDIGIHEFYLGNIFLDVKKLESFARMKVEFDHNKMIKFYVNKGKELLDKIKPKDL